MNTKATTITIHIIIHLFLSTYATCTTPPPNTNLTHLSSTHPHPPHPGSRHRKRETSPKLQGTSGFEEQDQVGVIEVLAGKPLYEILDKEGLNRVVGWRGHYYHSRPRPRNATTPLERVKIQKNEEERVSVASESSSFSPRSSSCSSISCKWFTSWEFMAVALLVVTWLVTLTSLGCLARTKFGKKLLDHLSSLCATEKNDDDNQVLAKGIGYFDGSPGMRRLVLIEDEDEDDEEDEEEDDENSDKSSGKTASTDGKDRAWRPPRKGTYILQDAAKDYVPELGTYRLQDDMNEETEEDKIAYVLEGGAYILETERQQRSGGIVMGGGIGEGMRLKYGFVRGNIARIHNIEGLYELIRQGEPSGVINYNRIGRIHDIEGLYGVVRQGETGGVIDNDRRGRIHDIEGLYGVIRRGEAGGVIGNRIGKGSYEFRDCDEGSVWREIERMTSVEIRDDVIGMERRRAETGISQRGSDEIGIEREREEIRRIRKLSLDEIMQRRNEIRQQIENGGETQNEAETQEIRRINTQRRERREDSIILAPSSLADNNSRIIKEIVTKTTSEGGTMLNPRRSLGGARPRANTSSYTRRAASFPMDNYCPVQLLPRKLSLILEEEVK